MLSLSNPVNISLDHFGWPCEWTAEKRNQHLQQKLVSLRNTQNDLQQKAPARIQATLMPNPRGVAASDPIVVVFYCPDCPVRVQFGKRCRNISELERHLQHASHKANVTARQDVELQGGIWQPQEPPAKDARSEDISNIRTWLQLYQICFPGSHFDGWAEGAGRKDCVGWLLFCCHDCGAEQPIYSMEGEDCFFEHLCTDRHLQHVRQGRWIENRARYIVDAGTGSITENCTKRPVLVEHAGQALTLNNPLHFHANQDIFLHNGLACGCPVDKALWPKSPDVESPIEEHEQDFGQGYEPFEQPYEHLGSSQSYYNEPYRGDSHDMFQFSPNSRNGGYNDNSRYDEGLAYQSGGASYSPDYGNAPFTYPPPPGADTYGPKESSFDFRFESPPSANPRQYDDRRNHRPRSSQGYEQLGQGNAGSGEEFENPHKMPPSKRQKRSL